MAFIDWDTIKKTNIFEIDEQHMKLIEIINQFHENFQQNSSKEGLLKILNQLQDYAKYHFETEERLLTKYQYPVIEDHKTEHEEFIDRIQSFYRGYSTREIQISYQVMTFIRSWISNHINQSDQEYVQHIK